VVAVVAGFAVVAAVVAAVVVAAAVVAAIVVAAAVVAAAVVAAVVGEVPFPHVQAVNSAISNTDERINAIILRDMCLPPVL